MINKVFAFLFFLVISHSVLASDNPLDALLAEAEKGNQAAQYKVACALIHGSIGYTIDDTYCKVEKNLKKGLNGF